MVSQIRMNPIQMPGFNNDLLKTGLLLRQQALDGISKGVSDYGTQMRDRNTNNVLAGILQVNGLDQMPQAHEQVLAQLGQYGQGVDSVRVLEALGKQQDALTARAGQQAQLSDVLAKQADRPLQSQALQLLSSGNMAGARQVMGTMNDPTQLFQAITGERNYSDSRADTAFNQNLQTNQDNRAGQSLQLQKDEFEQRKKSDDRNYGISLNNSLIQNGKIIAEGDKSGTAYGVIDPTTGQMSVTQGGGSNSVLSAAQALAPLYGGKPVTGVVGYGKGYTEVSHPDGTTSRSTANRNVRNNNPGNISNGDFAKQYGAVGGDDRFAVFPTPEAGRKAHAALIFESNMAKKLSTKADYGAGLGYKDKSLRQMINSFAPPEDKNDSNQYYNTILKAVGKDKRMGDYTPAERETILNAMAKHEGYNLPKASESQKVPAAPFSPLQAQLAKGEYDNKAASYTASMNAQPIYGKKPDGSLDAWLGKQGDTLSSWTDAADIANIVKNHPKASKLTGNNMNQLLTMLYRTNEAKETFGSNPAKEVIVGRIDQFLGNLENGRNAKMDARLKSYAGQEAQQLIRSNAGVTNQVLPKDMALQLVAPSLYANKQSGVVANPMGFNEPDLPRVPRPAEQPQAQTMSAKNKLLLGLLMLPGAANQEVQGMLLNGLLRSGTKGK